MTADNFTEMHRLRASAASPDTCNEALFLRASLGDAAAKALPEHEAISIFKAEKDSTANLTKFLGWSLTIAGALAVLIDITTKGSWPPREIPYGTGMLVFIAAIAAAYAQDWFFQTSARNNAKTKMIRAASFSMTPTATPETDNFAGSEFDTGAAFDPNIFGDARSSRRSGAQKSASRSRAVSTTPRGVDGRHPDDAKFWAIVDDPNAPPPERQAALAAALKAQEKRQSEQSISSGRALTTKAK